MADPPPYPDSNGDAGDGTGVGPDREPTTGTPLWVKVFGIIALVVILLFVILLLTRGPHRPGRHGSHIGGDGSHTPTPVVTEHTPTPGGHTPC